MQNVCHTVLAFIIYFKTITLKMPKIFFFTVFNLLYEGSSVIIIVWAVVVSLPNNENFMYTSIY